MSIIGRNIVWLMISQLATWMATLFTLLIVPDRLGSADFGSFGFANGYIQFFALLANLGTSTYLARAIARDNDLAGAFVWNAVLLKLALWAVLAALAFVLALALGIRGTTLVLIAIQCVGLLFFVLYEVFAGTLAGLQRLAKPAMWLAVQVYFQTIFGIAVLELGWGVVAYSAVMVSGTLIPMTATAIMVRPLARGHRRFDFHIWRLLVVGGIPLVTLTGLNLVYGTINVPILYNLVGGEAVGWYSLAVRWVGIPVFITTAVVAAFFPSMARHGKPLTPEFAPLVNRAVHIVLYVTVPASIGIALVADDLIRLLYDQEYDPTIVLIQILAIQMPIIAMDSVLATALVASDRLRQYLYVAAIAAALNPIASFVAINFTEDRYGNGAIGAATVLVATEFWVTIGAFYLRAPGVIDRHSQARIVRILIASAVMVPAMVFTGDWPLATQVLIAVATYGAVSLLCGAISIDELRRALRMVISSMRRNTSETDEGNLDDGHDTDNQHAPRVGGDLHP